MLLQFQFVNCRDIQRFHAITSPSEVLSSTSQPNPSNMISIPLYIPTEGPSNKPPSHYSVKPTRAYQTSNSKPSIAELSQLTSDFDYKVLNHVSSVTDTSRQSSQADESSHQEPEIIAQDLNSWASNISNEWPSSIHNFGLSSGIQGRSHSSLVAFAKSTVSPSTRPSNSKSYSPTISSTCIPTAKQSSKPHSYQPSSVKTHSPTPHPSVESTSRPSQPYILASIPYVEVILNAVPWIGSMEGGIIGLLLPGVIMLLHILYLRRGYFNVVRIVDEMIQYYVTKSGVILLYSVVIILCLCVNQIAYVQTHLSYSNDISYYLQVNLPEFDAISTIQSANTLTSFNVLVSSPDSLLSVQSRLAADPRSNAHKYLFPEVFAWSTSEGSVRRGQASSEYINRRLSSNGNSFVIIYHAKKYANLITAEYLSQICQIELAIRENMPCLDKYNYQSIIPTLTAYPDCRTTGINVNNINNVDSAEYSVYFQDNFNLNEKTSALLMSYTQYHTSLCGRTYTPDQLHALINSYTDGKLSHI